jgi:hypothetical protein
MIPTRESPVSSPNEDLQALVPEEGEGNAAWFRRSPIQAGIVLLGGTSLVDFRLRFAQSQLRSDLTPELLVAVRTDPATTGRSVRCRCSCRRRRRAAHQRRAD